MSKRTSDGDVINIGNVEAGAFAVGDHAHAEQHVTITSETFKEAVALTDQLRRAIDSLTIGVDAKAEVQQQLAAVRSAAQRQDPVQARSAVERLGNALKRAGAFVKDAVEVAEPFRKLATLLAPALHLLL